MIEGITLQDQQLAIRHMTTHPHGHGPLSSVSLGGSRVTTDQIRLYVPAKSNSSKL